MRQRLSHSKLVLEWIKQQSNIKPELDQKLVESYQKHLVEVQLVKGHLIKYQMGCVYIFEPVCIF
uniref:Uncharacterized protein n=1 Tax=Oreochromis aureus TaxID=47969 RepID=A0AAZ1WY76_OREAU